jgi:hypothetical protein
MAKAGTPVPPEIMIEMSGLPSSMKQKLTSKLEESKNNPMEMQAIQLKLQQITAQIAEIESKTQLNLAKAQGEATPPVGQVDTPADLAKANLDAAKAREIDHKIGVGAHIPKEKLPPPEQPGLFDLNAAKARQAHAAADREGVQAGLVDAQRVKTLMEAQTILDAPPGMLTNPPPPRPAGPAK